LLQERPKEARVPCTALGAVILIDTHTNARAHTHTHTHTHTRAVQEDVALSYLCIAKLMHKFGRVADRRRSHSLSPWLSLSLPCAHTQRLS